MHLDMFSHLLALCWRYMRYITSHDGTFHWIALNCMTLHSLHDENTDILTYMHARVHACINE